jgi:hypothetical protein
MVTKASNSVLNLVDLPIENLVLREGIFDNIVIGEHVPNEAFFTELTDTSLASPLIGTPGGLLREVFLGVGLVMARHCPLPHGRPTSDAAGQSPRSPTCCHSASSLWWHG